MTQSERHTPVLLSILPRQCVRLVSRCVLFVLCVDCRVPSPSEGMEFEEKTVVAAQKDQPENRKGKDTYTK